MIESLLDSSVRKIIGFADYCNDNLVLSILVLVLMSGWTLFFGAFALHKCDGKPASIKTFARLMIKTVFSRETWKL